MAEPARQLDPQQNKNAQSSGSSQGQSADNVIDLNQYRQAKAASIMARNQAKTQSPQQKQRKLPKGIKPIGLNISGSKKNKNTGDSQDDEKNQWNQLKKQQAKQRVLVRKRGRKANKLMSRKKKSRGKL